MTTETEMSSTGNHRHFDEIIACSSLLGNAAHAYINSPRQAPLLNGDGMQDDTVLPSLLQNSYNKLPFTSYQSQHALSTLEGTSALDFSRNSCTTNVDNVSSCYNYAYSEPFQLGSSREALVDNFLMGDSHISGAALPFNDSIKNNYLQPYVYLNSCLLDDILINDNYPLMSTLLSSYQEPQLLNPIHNPHSLSPLDFNHMHTNVNFFDYSPPSTSQSSSNYRLEGFQHTLCQPIAAAAAHGMSIVEGNSVQEQALFDDGHFQDGLFVSALFADGSKQELISEEYNLHGSLQSSSCDGQVGDAMLSLAVKSSKGDKDAYKTENPIKRDLSSPLSTNCFEDSSHFDAHHPSSSPTGQSPTNKRPFMEGDQEGPPRKRLTGMTSSARSDDVDKQKQLTDNTDHDKTDNDNNNNNNNERPSISNNTDNNNNNNNLPDNNNSSEVDKNVEEATPPSPNASVNKMDKSKNENYNNINTNTGSAAVNDSDNNNGKNARASKKAGTRGNNKPSSACDPQSIAARHRRERISERLKILQQLVPNGSKVDIVTMLEKAINYVKFLQLQVKVLTTDEYWPNSQKLNQPNEMSLLKLIMSKAKTGSSSGMKVGKARDDTSKS